MDLVDRIKWELGPRLPEAVIREITTCRHKWERTGARGEGVAVRSWRWCPRCGLEEEWLLDPCKWNKARLVRFSWSSPDQDEGDDE